MFNSTGKTSCPSAQPYLSIHESLTLTEVLTRNGLEAPTLSAKSGFTPTTVASPSASGASKYGSTLSYSAQILSILWSESPGNASLEPSSVPTASAIVTAIPAVEFILGGGPAEVGVAWEITVLDAEFGAATPPNIEDDGGSLMEET